MKYHATFLSIPPDFPHWMNTGFFNYMPEGWERAPAAQAPVIFVIFQGQSDYVFNEAEFKALAELRKPVVILDYYEGRLSAQHQLLIDAIGQLHIFCWFKRELRSSFVNDKPYPVYPIDFTHPFYPKPSTIDSREDYNARPIDILMSWGFSSRSRAELHGLLFHEYTKFATIPPAALPSDVPIFIEERGRCPLVLLYTPCYRRHPEAEIFDLQSKAKITVSCYGNGAKCFRNAEAGYNSLIAQMGADQFQWSYPWIDKHNCIALPNSKDSDFLDCRAAVDILEYWVRREHGSLYTLYVNSVLNTRNYLTSAYVRDYILPKLQPLCRT